MPTFIQETQSGPQFGAHLLAGDAHLIVDRPLAPSLDLAMGTVLGVLSASGWFAPLDETLHTSSTVGDGVTDTFDLGHDSVDGGALLVTVAGVPTRACTISPGSGAGGVDQVVFAAPPADTAAIVIQYQRTLATVAGVLYEAAVSGAGENPTVPVIQGGQVRRGRLVGLPVRFNHSGCRLGGLVLED